MTRRFVGVLTIVGGALVGAATGQPPLFFVLVGVAGLALFASGGGVR